MAGPRKPKFKPTRSQRSDVMLFRAAGMSEEAIAAAIGICRNTLRRFFSDELGTGHARKKAENLRRIEKAAKAGNVTAMKFLSSQIDVVPAQTQPEEPLGKKEQANREAQTAHEDTSWGNILN